MPKHDQSQESQSLAHRLKHARQEAGLSQKVLGQALKLSDKAISSYEVGRAQPDLETLKKIAHLTNKPASYFLEDTDPDDLDLQIKIKMIERELLEIKKLLRKRDK